MQLIIDIQNESLIDKIIKILEVFKNDGVKIQKQINTQEEIPVQYSDEYIEKNWQELISKALSNYDESYYKSDQYKMDRGEYLMEKYQR